MRLARSSFSLWFCLSSVAFAQLAPTDPSKPADPPPTNPGPEPPPPPPQPATAAPAPAPAPQPTAPPPAPAYGPPPPGYYYGPPPPAWSPPPPPAPKGVHRHDGFYLRMGGGLAQGHVTTETNDTPSFKATYDGLGPAYELMFGGTLGSGVVLGGGFVAQDISDPSIELEPDPGLGTDLKTDGALGILVIGPFIDWFFDETGGFHAGAMIGLGSIGLRDGNDNVSTGIGGSLFLGYDFWVADQWSLGVEGRALFISSERDFQSSKFEDRARGFQLLFTALYH